MATLRRIAARSPGIISSSDTPTIDTCVPNVSLIARRSVISSTHGTHHVAQTFMTRIVAPGANASAILAGSFTSTSFAAVAVPRLRQKTANGANVRIGAIHSDFDRTVLLVRLRALGVVSDEILRSK